MNQVSGILLTVYFFVSCVDSQEQSFNIHTRTAYFDNQFQNLVITTSIISVVPDISLVNCLRECNQLVNCVSFFYNSQSGICQLHGTVFSEINGSKVENGWRYYLMKGCPLGWIEFDQSCYLFEDADIKNWTEAKDICETYGGKLAEITTQETQDFVVSVVTTLNETSRADSSSFGYFLGGNDIANEGQWLWSSSGHALQYTAWYIGEPNSFREENCIAIFGPFQYRWVDYSCQRILNFICEREI